MINNVKLRYIPSNQYMGVEITSKVILYFKNKNYTYIPEIIINDTYFF